VKRSIGVDVEEVQLTSQPERKTVEQQWQNVAGRFGALSIESMRSRVITKSTSE